MEQNLVVRQGQAQKLKIINEFLEEARASGFLTESFARARLVGVEPPPPKQR
jgi:hypothetical protein